MTQRYTLGPLDTPTLVLIDTSKRNPYGAGEGEVDEFGVFWHCEYPTGWDDDDVSTPVDTPDGVDGALLGPQRLGHKQIGVTGLLIAPDSGARVAAQRRLRAAFPRRGSTPFAVTDEDGVRLWVPATRTGPLRIVPQGGQAAMYTFALVSPDPWRYGDVQQNVETGLPDTSSQAGVTVPFTLGGLVIAPSAPVGGSMILNQGGDLPAWPITAITGPALWPLVRNNTTGLYFQVGTRVPAGSRLTVDHRTGLIALDGIQVPVPLVGYGSTPWPLEPGRNDISWTSREDFDPRARLAVAWYPHHR